MIFKRPPQPNHRAPIVANWRWALLPIIDMIRSLTLLLLILLLACGNQQPTPEIRLVRDNVDGFHLQWNGPLREERIILVEMTTHI